MKLLVEIKSPDVKSGSGTDKKSGEPYNWAKQSGWLTLPEKPYPVEIGIRLDTKNNQVPYAAGNYEVGPESFWVDQYGGLRCTPKLVPVGK